MAAQVTISQLPTSNALTGTELVPVVQNGVTTKTSTQDIANLAALSPGAGVASFNSRSGAVVLLNSDVTSALGYTPGSVTSVSGTGTVNGLTLSGTVTGSGNLTLGGALTGVDLTTQVAGILPVANGGTGTATPSLVQGTNITITGTWPNQTINSTGGGGGSGTVTNIATGAGLSGGPITTTGTINLATAYGDTVNPYASKTANYVLAAPNGAAGVPTFRALADADIPTTLSNKTLASPAITGTVKLTGTGASSYTPFAQTFSSAVTNFNGYQLNYIQNTNNGSDASVDYVAYNDASDVDSYFIDMGISSSNYSNPIYTIFPANGAYVYTGGGTSGQAAPLLLGTSNAASDITLFTGGTLLANTRVTIKGNTGNVLVGTTTDTGYKLNVNGTTYFGGASTFGSTVLLNANPTLPLQAATKQYVDNLVASGFTVHDPVVYATTSALAANTYNNGSSGVGATLTANANGALSVDGSAVTVGQRILVKNEATAANNGCYAVTATGSGGAPYVLTRTTDFDTAGAGEIANNAYFFITSGATQAGDSYVLSQTAAITVGTTALPFTLFADQAVYTGGTNITVAGQTINVSGTIAATLGGTGTSTVATGDLLYGSGTDTWSKLPLGVAYKSLIVNASGTQMEWNAIPLNQTAAVSGALGVANGGTGATTLANASIATYTGAETLTNKRINPRVSTTTSTATLTPDISSYDQYNLTAQAASLVVSAPAGSPQDGNKLIFRILDNGTSQSISWNATYTAIGVTLPGTTTANKTLYVGCVYNQFNTRWDVIALTTQA
jgi:hypothetical protein